MAKILLVEDEKNLAFLYVQALGEAGHSVVCVEDGRTAVQMAQSEQPDLVIMDINLPEKMDGLESMSRMLGDNRRIPVITDTGYSEYKDSYMSWAAEAYIVKSADLSPLMKAVKSALDKTH